MADHNDISGEGPIDELKTFSVPPDPELQGRIRRDINRRTLASNSLEFSLTVMLQTFWEHLFALIDAWPGSHSTKEEDQDG